MGRISAAVVVVGLVVLLCVGWAAADAGPLIDDGGDGGGVGLVPVVDHLRSSLEKKEASIGAMETELAVLRDEKKEGGELEERVRELEERVVSATVQAEQAHKYGEALKRRAEAAEERARDLDAKYEASNAALAEAKKRAREAEKALAAAEATLAEAENRLHVHGEELTRVHSSWLPPWLAAKVLPVESRARAKWASHGRPTVDAVYGRAAAGAAAVKPHWDNVAGKARQGYNAASDSIAPHVEVVRARAVQGYDKVGGFIQPHYYTVVEAGRPYVAKVQERTRPYVDQLSTVSSAYAERTRTVVGPYYHGAVSGVAKSHETLQGKVREQLSKHESVASFFPDELVWLLAAGLLAFPVVASAFFLSSVLKTKSPPRRGAAPRSSASGTRHKRAKKVDREARSGAPVLGSVGHQAKAGEKVDREARSGAQVLGSVGHQAKAGEKVDREARSGAQVLGGVGHQAKVVEKVDE